MKSNTLYVARRRGAEIDNNNNNANQPHTQPTKNL